MRVGREARPLQVTHAPAPSGRLVGALAVTACGIGSAVVSSDPLKVNCLACAEAPAIGPVFGRG